MMMVPSDLKIFVARDAVDMRKSFDGLIAIIHQSFKLDSASSAMFVFFNKYHDKVKVLYWDRNGHAMWYKRLNKGRFRPPRIETVVYKMTMSDLNCLLEGIDLLSQNRLVAL